MRLRVESGVLMLQAIVVLHLVPNHVEVQNSGSLESHHLPTDIMKYFVSFQALHVLAENIYCNDRINCYQDHFF